MLQINYSKGIYTLTDGSKTYTFNINNGECKNTKTDNIVQKPAFKKDDIVTYLYRTSNRQGWGYTDMLRPLLERLDNWGMVAVFCSNSNQEWLKHLRIVDKLLNVLPQGYRLDSSFPRGIFELPNKEMAEVVNYVRTYNDRNNETINLSNFLNILEMRKIAEQFGDVPTEFVRKYQRGMEEIIRSPYKDIMWYYYYNQKLYMLRNDTRVGWGTQYYGLQYINMYIEYCRAIGKTPVKTNNFMREFLETQNSYDLWLQLEKDTRFASHYDRYRNNLTFEYGNYTVVLPTKGQDLVKEGSEMHHCVGGYVDNVANGTTLIVFIRHKDTPDQCYITAQINPHNGNLGQYYLAYDKHIHKEEDIEFKDKFQEWLHSCQW